MDAIVDTPLPVDKSDTLPKAPIIHPELMETNKSLKSKFAGISELRLDSQL